MVTELIVAAAVLMLGIGVVAKSNSSLLRLWEDTRHHQLAMDELSNRLDLLTRLSGEDLQQAIQQLQVSSDIAAVLPDADLKAILIQDQFGDRIELSLQWKRVGTGKPIRLVGWIVED
jgi:hypothetical protein